LLDGDENLGSQVEINNQEVSSEPLQSNYRLFKERTDSRKEARVELALSLNPNVSSQGEKRYDQADLKDVHSIC